MLSDCSRLGIIEKRSGILICSPVQVKFPQGTFHRHNICDLWSRFVIHLWHRKLWYDFFWETGLQSPVITCQNIFYNQVVGYKYVGNTVQGGVPHMWSTTYNTETRSPTTYDLLKAVPHKLWLRLVINHKEIWLRLCHKCLKICKTCAVHRRMKQLRKT